MHRECPIPSKAHKPRSSTNQRPAFTSWATTKHNGNQYAACKTPAQKAVNLSENPECQRKMLNNLQCGPEARVLPAGRACRGVSSSKPQVVLISRQSSHQSSQHLTAMLLMLNMLHVPVNLPGACHRRSTQVRRSRLKSGGKCLQAADNSAENLIKPGNSTFG